MTASRYLALTAIGLALLLSACAAQQRTAPELADEGTCRASVASYKCKLEHDLAGGYPFSLESAR